MNILITITILYIIIGFLYGCYVWLKNKEYELNFIETNILFNSASLFIYWLIIILFWPIFFIFSIIKNIFSK